MPSLSSISIQYLKGVGARRAKVFSKIGISNIEDLLYYFPRRYEDRSQLKMISQCEIGDNVTIEAEVLASGQKESWRRRNFKIVEVAFSDVTGVVFGVWFNQPYVKDCFEAGRKVILHGKLDLYKGRKQFANPEFEIINDEGSDSLSAGRIVPIYSITEGMTQRFLRKSIKNALDKYISKISDPLPYNIRNQHSLLNLAQSLMNIHFPQEESIQIESYRRLAFEEFFIHQIPVILRKMKKKEKKGIPHLINGEILSGLLKIVPFELTDSQKQVLRDVEKDMASGFAMQRLLQGEVGSGKTIVAILSACICLDSGYQVAFMAPTELLSNQHYEKIKSLFSNIKDKLGKKINIVLLTSNTSKKERNKAYQKIKKGEIQFVIGTHALLQEELAYKKLGLVVIDEQHKFGVAQRALLRKKADNPDVLIMTATPIPRTLSLTLYGDLDVSIIKELPKGRLPITTIRYQKEQIEDAYKFIRNLVEKKQQVYFVCPLIEESQELDIQAAEKIYKDYKNDIFENYKIGLVHGKLHSNESNMIMNDFKNGNIDILVATSILEVGIDVPRATCMIVLDAERFGLSQLHQLRGRIGRGSEKSYFIVVSQPSTKEARQRINAISQIADGFRIAEEDLKIRGPGEYFGKRQHGLSSLKIANPLTQLNLLKNAREEAKALLKDDSLFSKRQNQELYLRVKETFPGFPYLELTA